VKLASIRFDRSAIRGGWFGGVESVSRGIRTFLWWRGVAGQMGDLMSRMGRWRLRWKCGGDVVVFCWLLLSVEAENAVIWNGRIGA